MKFKEVMDIIFEETPVEIIESCTQTPDFWEVVGACGGDIYHYRVYPDRSVYEK